MCLHKMKKFATMVYVTHDWFDKEQYIYLKTDFMDSENGTVVVMLLFMDKSYCSTERSCVTPRAVPFLLKNAPSE